MNSLKSACLSEPEIENFISSTLVCMIVCIYKVLILFFKYFFMQVDIGTYLHHEFEPFELFMLSDVV